MKKLNKNFFSVLIYVSLFFLVSCKDHSKQEKEISLEKFNIKIKFKKDAKSNENVYVKIQNLPGHDIFIIQKLHSSNMASIEEDLLKGDFINNHNYSKKIMIVPSRLLVFIKDGSRYVKVFEKNINNSLLSEI